MTAKEWLDVMKQAADYNPVMTALIEKYGDMLLEEQNLAIKNFRVAGVTSMSSLMHHCGNELTEKEVFHDHCLKCSEYISED